jgi:hypothetical protein
MPQPNWPAQTPPPAIPVAPKKRWRKPLIITLTVITALLVGGGAAYAYLRSTPEMILSDAFYNTSRQTQGRYDMALDLDGDTSAQLSVKGAWKDERSSANVKLGLDGPSQFSLQTDLVMTKDELFVKAGGLTQFYQEYAPSLGMNDPTIERLMAKLDGKWITITDKDLEEYFGIEKGSDNLSCVESKQNEYQASKQQQKEVYEVFRRNQFIVMKKLPDENVGDRRAYSFDATIDSSKVKGFQNEIKNTAAYKAFVSCDGSAVSNQDTYEADDTNDDKAPAIRVYVDKATRTFRKVQVDYKGDQADTGLKSIKAAITFDFWSPLNVTVPKSDYTLKQLQAEIEATLEKLDPEAAADLPLSASDPL